MKPRILVLCTGNSARSQMAEAFLKALLGDRAEVFSAGTRPVPVNPLAIEVMAELGIDISGQSSKSVAEFLGQRFSHIVTVCDRAAEECPTFPGTAIRLHVPFEDPVQAVGSADERLEVFRRVRDQIKAWAEAWVSDSFRD
ncbi:MAG: arsenate reductase ArsC [candidate division WOR-3 bacterium]